MPKSYVKIVSFILLQLVSLFLMCSCEKKPKEYDTENPVDDYTIINSTISGQDISQEEILQAKISQEDISQEKNLKEEICRLFEENIYCVKSIFSGNNLDYYGEPVQGENVYRVSSDKFKKFSDYDNYIRTIYCTKEADRLIYHYPYENSPMYLNVNGELCIDGNMKRAKGYYTDWTDYEIIINYIDEDRCEFTTKGYIEEPADIPIREEYLIEGAAVLENEKWVLEKMIY